MSKEKSTDTHETRTTLDIVIGDLEATKIPPLTRALPKSAPLRITLEDVPPSVVNAVVDAIYKYLDDRLPASRLADH